MENSNFFYQQTILSGLQEKQRETLLKKITLQDPKLFSIKEKIPIIIFFLTQKGTSLVKNLYFFNTLP